MYIPLQEALREGSAFELIPFQVDYENPNESEGALTKEGKEPWKSRMLF